MHALLLFRCSSKSPKRTKGAKVHVFRLLALDLKSAHAHGFANYVVLFSGNLPPPDLPFFTNGNKPLTRFRRFLKKRRLLNSAGKRINDRHG